MCRTADFDFPGVRSKALREVMRELLDTADRATHVVKNISGVRQQGLVRNLDLDDGRAVLVGDAELIGIATKYAITFVAGAEGLLVRSDGVVAWRGEGDAESALRQGIYHPIE